MHLDEGAKIRRCCPGAMYVYGVGTKEKVVSISG